MSLKFFSKLEKSPYGPGIVVGILSFLIIWPVINNEKSYRLDVSVVKNVKNAENLTDYFKKVKRGEILDIQPIRDLTYFLDSKLSLLLGFDSEVLFNTIIWIFTILVASKVLTYFIKDRWASFLGLMFFGTHPMMVYAIGMAINRKHLLAVFFAMLSIVFFINRSRKYNFSWTIIFFLLSLMSHPILIFLPLVYFGMTYLYEKGPLSRKDLLLIFLLLSCSFLVGVGNLYYYRVVLKDIVGYSTVESGFSLADSILVYGRSTFNILFPFKLAITYSPGSIENMYGIAAFCLLGFFAYKTIGVRKTLFFLSFIIFSVLSVAIRKMHSFLNDSYLVLFSFSVFLLIFFTINSINKRQVRKSVLILFSIISVFFFSKSYLYGRTMSDSILFSRSSYEMEDSCLNLRYLLTELLRRENFKEASFRGVKYLNSGCAVMGADKSYFKFFDAILIINVLYHSRGGNFEDKLSRLDKLGPRVLYYPVIRSAFQIKNGFEKDGLKTISEFLNSSPRKEFLVNYFFKPIYSYCEKNATNNDCKGVLDVETISPNDE